MSLEELIKAFNDYITEEPEYKHKEKALQEFDKVREKFTLDELQHIGFIVNDYPKQDHLLIKIGDDDSIFIRIGISRNWLVKNKQDIPTIAGGIYDLVNGLGANEEK